ncbi:hypothetical protein [Saliniramus sp.]|nr:hypothetical protein [Saliniramus sp.]HMB10108.1 hypothetical protein [Saliniramus sp.]
MMYALPANTGGVFRVYPSQSALNLATKTRILHKKAAIPVAAKKERVWR